MTSHSFEEKYVTLRAIAGVFRGILRFYRRFRWGCLTATAISLIPTIYLIYCMLTTGFPKPFWGPFGRITTFPGYLIVERVFGHLVSLASPELSYAQLVRDWVLMLCVNFLGWLLILVAVTAVLRFLLRKRTSPR